jgi:hypothetical protein
MIPTQSTTKLFSTGTEVNAGYTDGHSPDDYYLYLKNYGLDLNPDFIVLSFFIGMT